MTIGDTVRAATSDAAHAVRRRLTLWAVLALFVATAFGFATAALFLALASPLGPLWACVVIAAAYSVVALIIALVATTRAARQAPADHRREEARLSDTDAVGHLIAVFAAAYRAARD